MLYNPLPIFISAIGFYFLIRLRFFFILHPMRVGRQALSAIKEKGAFSSLALALAGTLGVGNVLGVAVGIIVGGAGSVFWLFISVSFSAVIKYCEVVISSDRESLCFGERGGMYPVIKASFSHFGGMLSMLYALLCLLLSFFMGAALQSLALVDCLSETLGVNRYIGSFILAVFLLFAVYRGERVVSKVTAVIIPLTTIIYIIMSLACILSNVGQLPSVIKLIVLDAFDFSALGGGIIAFLFSRPFTEGYARGILSNEAGAGTSAIAHSGSHIATPRNSGIMGIVEVYFDTALLCMLTAFTILTAVEDYHLYTSAMALVLDAVGLSLGTPFRYLLLFCIISFAYSTVICWYSYGAFSSRKLFGFRSRSAFSLLFFIFVLFGFALGNNVLVFVTDLLLLLLSLISLSTLIKNSDRIVTLSEFKDE